MKESDFNSIFVSSINTSGGKAYKIPDPQKGEVYTSSQRPFDLFGSWNNKCFFVESKMEKSEHGSFNFKRLADHQKDALDKFNIASGDSADSLVVLAYWQSRSLFEVYVFDYTLIKKLLESGKKSIIKKEILILKENDFYVNIRKKKFNVTELFSKIIGVDKWEKMIGK